MKSNGVESCLIVAVTMAHHVESVAESGVASVVMTRQGVVEPCSIHRRRWSRIVAIIAASQGVMEPHEIYCRKWSRITTVTVASQGVQACRPKLDWGVWWREVVLRLRGAWMLLASLLPLGALGASAAGEGHLL